MTKSPLARVVASKPVPAPVVSTPDPDAIPTPEEIKAYLAFAPATKPTFVQMVGRGLRVPPERNRPDFGKFIDEVSTKLNLNYTPYLDSEAKTRRDAAKITAALTHSFPDWDVHEVVEAADYKPPFSYGWTFTQKAGS